jgi:N-acetyl-gamma-glutamyl-phosphate reductase
MGVQVAVAGASGYAGGELLRLLAAHPDLVIGPITAGASAGQVVTALHPQLPQLAGRTLEKTDARILSQADLVFLALPHGESARLAGQLPGEVRIVDLGADFRLGDPAAWQRFYGTPHAGRWIYGLPELPAARDGIGPATRVAVPGCYATAAILALAPLLASGLAEPGDIVVTAASGSSGAGRTPQPHLMGAEVMGSVAAYQAGGAHRHTPEVEQALSEAAGTPVTISFTPALAAMPRGILAVCTARLTGRVPQDGADATECLRAAVHDAYDGEPFVHLLPGGSWPATAATAGSNAAHLQVAADRHAGRAVAVAAIDNLGKGAAGQAVQVANLMLGLPETAGLTAHGVAP